MTFCPQPKPAPRLLERRQRAADKGLHWREVQAVVRAHEHGRCVVCGKPGHEVHHVVYRSHGGRDVPDNLALLCVRCHEDAHAKLITLTRARQGWTHERKR